MTHFFRTHLVFALGTLAVALFLLSEAVFALPVRLLSWEPERLAPPSIAPGEEREYTAVFTPTLPVPKIGSLRASLSGPAADFLTALTIDLPPETKNTLRGGTAVPLRLAVRIPEGTTVGSYPGILTLRYGEGGLPLLFAPDLAVDLTVSTISVPPDPGKAGKESIAGIDANVNGVRDDVERFIVFSYPDLTPEHENTRNALFQYAEAAGEGLLVADDKEAARVAGEEVQKAVECGWFVMNNDINSASRAQNEITAQLLNTVARTKAHSRYSSQLSGKIFHLDSGPTSAENCQFEPM